MPPLRQSIVQSESRVQTRQLCTYKVAAAASDKCYEPSLHAWGLSWMWWYLLFLFSFFLFLGGFLIISWPSCRSINLKLLEIVSIVVHLDHPHVLRALGAYYCQTVLRKCFFIIECLTFHVTEYQATVQGNLSILYSILVSGIPGF